MENQAVGFLFSSVQPEKKLKQSITTTIDRIN